VEQQRAAADDVMELVYLSLRLSFCGAHVYSDAGVTPQGGVTNAKQTHTHTQNSRKKNIVIRRETRKHK